MSFSEAVLQYDQVAHILNQDIKKYPRDLHDSQALTV